MQPGRPIARRDRTNSDPGGPMSARGGWPVIKLNRCGNSRYKYCRQRVRCCPTPLYTVHRRPVLGDKSSHNSAFRARNQLIRIIAGRSPAVTWPVGGRTGSLQFSRRSHAILSSECRRLSVLSCWAFIAQRTACKPYMLQQVCPSVRPCVCSSHCIKTAERVELLYGTEATPSASATVSQLKSSKIKVRFRNISLPETLPTCKRLLKIVLFARSYSRIFACTGQFYLAVIRDFSSFWAVTFQSFNFTPS